MAKRFFVKSEDTTENIGIYVDHLVKWSKFEDDFSQKLGRWFSRSSTDPGTLSYSDTLNAQFEKDALTLLKLFAKHFSNQKSLIENLDAFLDKIGEKINNNLNIDPEWRKVWIFEYLLNANNILDKTTKSDVFKYMIKDDERLTAIKKKKKLSDSEIDQLSQDLEKDLRSQFLKGYLFKIISLINTNPEFKQKHSSLIESIEQPNLTLQAATQTLQNLGNDYFDLQFFSKSSPGHEIEKPTMRERGVDVTQRSSTP